MTGSFFPDGPVVIDGGLGTLLERSGHDVDTPLWSARLLIDSPESIVDAHRRFFAAGARVAISSSYQASFEGLEAAGAEDPAGLLTESVRLARLARDEVAGDGVRRLVAASVGPFGAMRADGSEYTGAYGLRTEELRRWHEPRLRVFAESGADLLAFETIPSVAEAEALVSLVAGTGTPAWLSMTVALGRLRTGEPMAEAFRLAAEVEEIVAVGINCSNPAEVLGAISAAREVTDKPVVVYPNSGEDWDAKNRRWTGAAAFPAELVTRWLDAGAQLVGGCCRVGPDEIASISRVVSSRLSGSGQ